MSELMNASAERKVFRDQLLITVSTLALLTFACRAGAAQAADGDTDRPSLWIELGGQLESISGQGDPFVAPFMTKYADSVAFKPISPLDAEKAPKFGMGAEGKISFEPADTNWVFSAAMRYGRANGNKQVHDQTPGIKFPTTSFIYQYGIHSYAIDKFAEISAQSKESHAIIDFQVGKDVGLGMFADSATSVVNLGVRFVQFTSGSNVSIHARPYLTFPGAFYHKYFRNYALVAEQARSFRGVGPSLSWSASVPVIGNSRDGDVTLDWGANASVLFGRQKANEQHQTSGEAFVPLYGYKSLYHHHPSAQSRARSVIVPNIGGFASVSYRFADAALTLGYRGDFFFGAVDGGIDTAKRTTLGFHGPFATISIGIGG